MANLFDYLDWRGDVPLTVDPLGEVDALLLAELAYTWFEDIPAEGELSLQSATLAFFRDHSREALRNSGVATDQAPLLLDGLCAGARFGTMRMSRYINEVDREKEAQISAVTYLLSDGSAFVAFRGTDSSLVGWKEDFDFSYLPETEGQRRAVGYLNAVGAALDRPLRVGGHSKGGNFAVYAASFCDSAVQDRIRTVYAFDAPGFRTSTLSREGYRRILPRVVRILPDTSLVGRLLSSDSRPQVVKSAAAGVSQHDGFTWLVRRNRFVPAEVSELGRLIDQTLGDWLEQMDDDTRRSLTDTVFSLFASTGQDSFHGMSEQKWKSAEAMLGSVAGLPREKRQELLRLLGKLLQSGGQSATARLPGRVGERWQGERG